MISSETIEKAIAIGYSQAQEVIAFRDQELQRRAQTILEAPEPSRRISAFELKAEVVSSLGPQARDVLIAEGDSWFDYPFHDVLRILEDHHGYDVESVR